MKKISIGHTSIVYYKVYRINSRTDSVCIIAAAYFSVHFNRIRFFQGAPLRFIKFHFTTFCRYDVIVKFSDSFLFSQRAPNYKYFSYCCCYLLLYRTDRIGVATSILSYRMRFEIFLCVVWICGFVSFWWP